MLGDTVKNQLAAISLWAQMGGSPEDFQVQLDGINASIDQIDGLVDSLSEEAIRAWKVHYREAVANATELEPA